MEIIIYDYCLNVYLKLYNAIQTIFNLHQTEKKPYFKLDIISQNLIPWLRYISLFEFPDFAMFYVWVFQLKTPHNFGPDWIADSHRLIEYF